MSALRPTHQFRRQIERRMRWNLKWSHEVPWNWLLTIQSVQTGTESICVSFRLSYWNRSKIDGWMKGEWAQIWDTLTNFRELPYPRSLWLRKLAIRLSFSLSEEKNVWNALILFHKPILRYPEVSVWEECRLEIAEMVLVHSEIGFTVQIS